MPRGNSEHLTPSTAKRSRTSGKHSRNGCRTCKIRRVKCDETRPICVRCQNFKIVCDGYRRTPGTLDSASQSKRPSLAPKPALQSRSTSPSPSASSIPSSPSALGIDDAEEYRYFSFFKDHLLFEITQSAQADVFKTLVLQATVIPSTRHAMIALAALGKTHSLLERDNSGFLSTRESHEVKVHRDYSLRRYDKALASIKEGISAGRQDVKITLLTCLLIICIECLHGNFAMAGVQISYGMALLREWRKGYPNAKDHPIGLSSPAPNVIEDSLVQMLGGLDIQSTPLEHASPRDVHLNGMADGQRMITDLPAQFQSLEESRIHLDILIRRSNPWLRSVGAFQKSFASATSSPVPSVHFTRAEDPSYFNAVPIVPSQRHHLGNLSEPSPHTSINVQQALYIQEFQTWKAIFDALTLTTPTISTNPSFKDQLLVYECILLTLRAIVPSTESESNDHAKDLRNISTLAESIIDEVPEEDTTAFNIYQRLTSTAPPYSIGLDCKAGPIRRGSAKLSELFSRNKLLDGMIMKAIARWVMELGDGGVREGQSPDFERSRHLSVSTDGSRSSRSSTIVYDYDNMMESEI